MQGCIYVEMGKSMHGEMNMSHEQWLGHAMYKQLIVGCMKSWERTNIVYGP